MLIFKRRSGESFTIGESLITLHIQGNQVKFVIEAPKSINIHRDNAVAKTPKHNPQPTA